MNKKQNVIKIEISGPVGSGKSAIAGLLANALRMVGVNYRWNEEVDEGRLVGGNWGQALRDLKPEVCIEEMKTNGANAFTENLDFGQALAALEAGSKVQRAGWNGKGMFIWLVGEDHYVPSSAALEYFGTSQNVKHNPFLQIKNVDDSISTWVPSVNDCLAKDWVIIQ